MKGRFAEIAKGRCSKRAGNDVNEVRWAAIPHQFRFLVPFARLRESAEGARRAASEVPGVYVYMCVCVLARDPHC